VIQYNFHHINNGNSIECYLPYFNFSYCEFLALFFSRKGYKCVYSIHHWVLVNLPLPPNPITCITCIFLVKRLVVYSQYVTKRWPTVLLADDSLIWYFDLKCSCLSKVEHNRRCITDIDALIRRLPLSRSKASYTLIVMRRFH
jgi:hypothetical protein